MNRRIGIVGGMGPAAGNYFAQKITELAPATCDQEHPVVVHISNSQIPDRSAYLAGNGADPAPEIIRTIQQLDLVGIDVICVPCNTAHAPELFDRYAIVTQTPIIHMIQETMRTIRQCYPEADTAVVFGTDGTRAAKSFDAAGRSHDIQISYPDDRTQANVMKLIYAIKRRGLDPLDVHTLEQLTAGISKDKICILGCTELSMLANKLRAETGTRIIDSLECLAQRALNLPPSLIVPAAVHRKPAYQRADSPR